MGKKESLDEKGRVRRNRETNPQIYVGVEVRGTEEGAEDEKGKQQQQQTNKQTKNTTGTITGKGHVTEVWKKGWVVDG